jgi:hypothetical protein
VTVAELAALLRRHGVPEHYYCLDGGLGAGECYGLEPADGGWRVYYSERGHKNALDRVTSEDAACRALLGYVNASMQHRFGRTIAPPA